MSLTTPEAATGSAATRPIGGTSRAGAHWRRNRIWWLGGAAALLVAGVLALGSGGDHPSEEPLDPGNPGPDGTRALARVLGHHGVTVEVAHGQESFLGKRVDAGTTVVVTSTGSLSSQTARALVEHSAEAGSIVIVQPQFDTMDALALPVSMTIPSGGQAGAVTAGCPVGLLDGLSMDVAASYYYRGLTEAGGTGCFAARTGDGYRLWRVPGSPERYVLGADRVLTNDGILDGDNAAIALRLLGQHDRVVWYVADVRDVPIGDTGSVASNLPRWLKPGIWLVTVSVLALMYWRGRRLGRVVFEPLPVVIRSVESTLSRGRLYRKVRDRQHAGDILRRATRARVAGTLRLPPDLSVPLLADAVVRRTAREPEAVRRLLSDGPVGTDRDLTDLAQALADLEKEVRQP